MGNNLVTLSLFLPNQWVLIRQKLNVGVNLVTLNAQNTDFL